MTCLRKDTVLICLVPDQVYSGGSEQVKQVKQLLHWKSEAESAKNLANWQIYPVFF